MSASRADASGPAEAGYYVPYKRSCTTSRVSVQGAIGQAQNFREGDLSRATAGNRHVWKHLGKSQVKFFLQLAGALAVAMPRAARLPAAEDAFT